MTTLGSYNPKKIESDIQKKWQENRTFRAKEDTQKEKFYCLTMFPYPSGYLHIGHTRVYTIGDMITRYQRMLGKNVMQPMGLDAFGLPTENAAIKRGLSPAKWTYESIDYIHQQFNRLGYGYDWDREVITCKPEYYKWEQWLFTEMYKKGLVYRKNSAVNWDPVDQTVLANEQVVDGKGWRSGAQIERKEIPQWFFKITAYAEELLNDLDQLENWPEPVRIMQRNWIGRSEGVEMTFPVKDQTEPLTIYTTRADTLFGITFMAIAAEHPLAKLAAEDNTAIGQFIEECRHTKVAEADIETMEKKGIETKFKAVHPLTGKEIPIWVTNYVLMEYGSGAVMAVPAHDQRDYDFARKYGLPIKAVIKPATDAPDTDEHVKEAAFIEKGVLFNSGEFSGMTSPQSIDAIAAHFEKRGIGGKKVHYRLRDWGVSRQRYWGAPIPMIYCNECGIVPVPLKDLPVVLPEDVEFKGVKSPLKTMPSFYNTNCPKCDRPAKRETDTFDTFVDSSWYYTRYTCPHQHRKMLDERAHYWLPVDQYVGGIEHAVLHLLYARFFHKVLRDLKLVPGDEPFKRLLSQGMVLKEGMKMSKSKGNTVDPNYIIENYGADTARFFIIFAAPPTQSLEWSDSGVDGTFKFLKRLWQFAADRESSIISLNAEKNIDWTQLGNEDKMLRHETYQLLKQADNDMQRQQYNTVAAACMKLLNHLKTIAEKATGKAADCLIHEAFSILLRILHPIAPHITAHLWEKLNYGSDILQSSWPKVIDLGLDDVIQADIAIQINGKLRAAMKAKKGEDQKTLEKAALENEKAKKFLAGKSIKKIIVIPDKIVNIVVKSD